jgi:hypothetical protein
MAANISERGIIVENRREDMELARAYIKIQRYNQRWQPMEGLMRGTIFPELYRPYGPREAVEPEARVETEAIRSTRPSFRTSVRGGKQHGRR